MTAHQPFDPDRDLALSRLIKAPRDVVWAAWSDPEKLAAWWVPEPARCQVTALELQPGGSFTTRISEDGGAFLPHLDACFLAVEDGKSIVFTDALTGGWRPAGQGFMTATITFADHQGGTEYAARVMHGSPTDRRKHEDLGFHDGWVTVADQLARFVERATR